MQVQRNFSLLKYNTFGIDVKSNYFVEVFTDEDLQEFLYKAEECPRPPLVIGGGSNMLFLGDFPGTTLKISITGIKVISEDDHFIYVKASAGEDWDDFVGYCTEKGWGGLENLSLIPGKVGTSPVQNIGAYGVEIKDTMTELEALHIDDFATHTFTNKECRFGYRDSIFKNELKGKYIIISVTFRLSKHPVVNTSYGNLNDELEKMGIKNPGIADVREAVIRVRSKKLPEPSQIGNAGSFFKNPVISAIEHKKLKLKYPGLVSFPNGEDFKIAAAWLIEQCGWRGKRKGEAGVHSSQPLVLVNYGKATGKDILDLSEEIRADVLEKFGIRLETEVNIISGSE